MKPDVKHARFCDLLDESPTFSVEPSMTRPGLAWRRCNRCGAVALADRDRPASLAGIVATGEYADRSSTDGRHGRDDATPDTGNDEQRPGTGDEE